MALADENRKSIGAEVDRAKSAADTDARQAAATADARMATVRENAKGRVIKAAEDAAIDIVSRLTGETVSPNDAAAAVRAATGA
jgi:F0F1-type ATP synthase membrane subunit b/b'